MRETMQRTKEKLFSLSISLTDFYTSALNIALCKHMCNASRLVTFTYFISTHQLLSCFTFMFEISTGIQFYFSDFIGNALMKMAVHVRLVFEKWIWKDLL